MKQPTLGDGTLGVSRLGFGAGQIGGDELAEADVARLLGGALDLGLTLFDTARSYGRSEERIGRHLGHRRHELLLSTKGGYGVEGVPDWTYEAVARGLDEALRRLRTDWIDLFHLHSCPRAILERGEVTRALEDAQRAGKLRVAAYSGENDELDWAVGSGRFGAVQCSVNVCDQRSLGGAIPAAAERGITVIGKRPLANAPWRHAEPPLADDARVYWDRWRAMGLPLATDGLDSALRFSAFSPGVSCVIVGTARLEHLRQSVAAVDKGPLAADERARLAQAFAAHADEWGGLI